MLSTKCPKCDLEIKDKVDICPNCGNQLNIRHYNSKLFLLIFIIGCCISLFGNLLFIDSLLYYLPDYYSNGMNSADWKEFFIGFALINIGIFIPYKSSNSFSQNTNWFNKSKYYKAPIYCFIAVIIIVLIFKFEISRPHWFTTNVELHDQNAYYLFRERVLNIPKLQ